MTDVKLSFGSKMKFGIADFGLSAVTSCIQFFMLFYYTDVVHISPGIAGLLQKYLKMSLRGAWSMVGLFFGVLAAASTMIVGFSNKFKSVVNDEPVKTPALKALFSTLKNKSFVSFLIISGIMSVAFASTVDSLLAIKHLVFDQKICSMATLIEALKNNWEGYEKLRLLAKNKAPKYGRNDEEADRLAQRFMKTWTDEVWKYKTSITDAQLRPGMLSWNYWIKDGYILPASPDGRKKGQFLSNAICPVNGSDTKGPTANINSVGEALGGKRPEGDFLDYVNFLPNGASHTITLSSAMVRDAEHKEKVKALIKGCVENGGTALQINILDAETLIDAQKNPSEYRHLLVRVTGYNAYFTSLGKELQDEIIAREVHNC